MERREAKENFRAVSGLLQDFSGSAVAVKAEVCCSGQGFRVVRSEAPAERVSE